jgi:hypothetical protein
VQIIRQAEQEEGGSEDSPRVEEEDREGGTAAAGRDGERVWLFRMVPYIGTAGTRVPLGPGRSASQRPTS